MIVQNATFFTERVNMSCTPASVFITANTPNVFITPSQTVTMMDDFSYATTLVSVVVSVVGLLLISAIVVVAVIILFVCKKTKKQKLAEFAKSRLVTCFALLL